MRNFQFVEIQRGTPYEMGFQYGRQAREKIRAGIAEYRELFAEICDMSWEEILAYAESFVPLVRKALPEVLEEARGIASGCEVSESEIMMLNCRYEITKFPRTNECTSFAALPEATGSEKTFVGQNWDYRAGILDNIVILHAEQSDGTRILGLAEAGQVIRNGFNSHGVGLCANNLQSVHDSRGVGVPVTFLRRRALSSRTLEEARNFIVNSKRDVSCNFMLASAKGKALDIEAYPGGADRIEPQDGILTHANHFVVNPKNEALETTPRGERLEELLRKKHGKLDVPYIKKCLSDHENYPKAICRHPADIGVRLGRRSITVAGVVYDLSDGVAHICAGPPCEGEFIPYKI